MTTHSSDNSDKGYHIVVEKGEESEQTLATNVEIADSLLASMKGLMGRSSFPNESGLVLEPTNRFVSASPQAVHMLFVLIPIDVLWLVDGEVNRVARLQPWHGFGVARADRIIELPAGTAESVETGDTVQLKHDT